MALPSCRRCGTQDPHRMHALMNLWFGPLVELESDLGYFYLCPGCHDEIIAPELERIQNRILELHPVALRAAEDAEGVEGGPRGVGGDGRDPVDGSAVRDDSPADDGAAAADDADAEEPDAG